MKDLSELTDFLEESSIVDGEEEVVLEVMIADDLGNCLIALMGCALFRLLHPICIVAPEILGMSKIDEP